MTISERLRTDVGGQVFVQRGIWSVQGLHQHATLTRGLRPLLGWDQTRACVCVWGMTASWQHVCRVSWEPGTCWWRNQVGSPPAVASCPATPGVVLTGLSLWPEVAPICFPPDFSKSLLPLVIQSSYVPVIWTCSFIHICSFKLSSESIKSSRTGEVGQR